VGWSREAHGSRGGAPGGSRGGAPGGAALTFAPDRAAGGVFSPRDPPLGDKWLDRAGAGCPSWARKKRRMDPLCV
jgi:hypothetical protein